MDKKCMKSYMMYSIAWYGSRFTTDSGDSLYKWYDSSNTLLLEGRSPDAVKFGTTGAIPEGPEKPKNVRVL